MLFTVIAPVPLFETSIIKTYVLGLKRKAYLFVSFQEAGGGGRGAHLNGQQQV